MNNNERENLKKKITADLELLMKESWDIDVKNKLRELLDNLEKIHLEGYDD